MKAVNSIGILLLFIGIGLMVLNQIFPHTVIVQESAQITRNRETVLERANDYRISGSSYSGYDLEAGKTIVISWQADNNVIVYFMTESQFNIYKPLGIPSQNLKSQSGMSGSFSYSLSYDGKYYVVIYNPNWLLTQVRIVSYESKLTWQETDTVTTSKEVNDNLYFYIGLPITITGAVLLIVGNLMKYTKTAQSSSDNSKKLVTETRKASEINNREKLFRRDLIFFLSLNLGLFKTNFLNQKVNKAVQKPTNQTIKGTS